MPGKVTRSVSHRVSPANPRGLSAVPLGVPQVSLSQAIAALETQVPDLTAVDCVEALAAVARLGAVLSARNVALAAAPPEAPPASAAPALLDAHEVSR